MMHDEDEMITIPKELFDSLIDSQRFLECLENAGVDNWGGYEFAMQDYQEGEFEE